MQMRKIRAKLKTKPVGAMKNEWDPAGFENDCTDRKRTGSKQSS
jgi:hypothetical protein